MWFTMRLLEHIYCQRQFIQRMAVTKAAAAQQEYLQQQLYSTFPDHITSDRFRKALGTALDRYAHVRLVVGRRQVLGLAPQSLVGCCAVCRRGHLEFLQDEQAVSGVPGAPAASAGVTSDATAGHAAVSNSGAAAAASVGAMPASAAPEGSDTAGGGTTAAAATAGGASCCDPAVATRKPAFAAAALGAALVVHSVMIDGLQKMRHFAAAGKIE